VGLSAALDAVVKRKILSSRLESKPRILCLFESRQGLGIFLFTIAFRQALRPTQPLVQRMPGAISLGVKRTDRKADYSPPRAEFRRAIPPVSQYAFMKLCSVKAQGQIIFINN